MKKEIKKIGEKEKKMGERETERKWEREKRKKMGESGSGCSYPSQAKIP